MNNKELYEQILHMPEFKKYLQENARLQKRLKMAALTGSKAQIDYIVRNSIEAFIKHTTQPKTPFSTEYPLEYVMGDIGVGVDANNPSILLKSGLESLSGHMILAGSTGSGKTNSINVMLDQIQKQHGSLNVRYMVFAPKVNCEQRKLIINNQPGSAFFF